MKKRLLAVFLALMLVVSLLPANVLATEPDPEAGERTPAVSAETAEPPEEPEPVLPEEPEAELPEEPEPILPEEPEAELPEDPEDDSDWIMIF